MNPDGDLFKTVYFVSSRHYARSIACNPKVADQFVIGEACGRLTLHSIRNRECIRTITLPRLQNERSLVTACSYTRDAKKIVCTLYNQKLCVVDVESGKVVRIFDDCAYKTDQKSGLAVDKCSDNIWASTDLKGRGVTFYDYRQETPTGIAPKMHITWVPTLEFVPDDWPWSRYCNCLVTVCTDGQLKVISLDGKLLEDVDVGHMANGCALTPEGFEGVDDNFTSFAAVAGDGITTVLPGLGVDRKFAMPPSANALCMKFSSSGSRAFVGCDDGTMRIFQRLPQSLRECNTLLLHQKGVTDLALTASDEFVVTTSHDGHVCVTKVGMPNHGATEWYEIA